MQAPFILVTASERAWRDVAPFVPSRRLEGDNDSKRTADAEKRERIRNEFFDDEEAWTGKNEKGWFKAPRTLPLIPELLSSKELSGNYDPTGVYLELLSRHIDGGIIEMTDEAAPAYGAGYFRSRAIRCV